MTSWLFNLVIINIDKTSSSKRKMETMDTRRFTLVTVIHLKSLVYFIYPVVHPKFKEIPTFVLHVFLGNRSNKYRLLLNSNLTE